MKQVIWDRFCDRFNVMEQAVSLFATDPDGHVQSKPIGKDGWHILKRSEECDRLILNVTDQLVNDWVKVTVTSQQTSKVCTRTRPSLPVGGTVTTITSGI